MVTSVGHLSMRLTVAFFVPGFVVDLGEAGRKKSEDAARPETNVLDVLEVADSPADGCFATDVIAISVRHQRSPQQLVVRVTVTVLVLPADTENERGP